MGLFDFFKKKTSKDIAKDRLKLVLVSDRAGVSPEMMEQMKNDIIKVITKYIEIEEDGLEIKVSQTESELHNGNVPVLYANIPIKDMKKN
ncbi:MAG: cell division topological specificity factor MinE [Clostridiales bacterium]|nr:cell division topological specificity factor MinE [Clostridiales bacterium]